MAQGRPGVFTRLHAACIVHLVADNNNKADTVPETLLLDVNRLGSFGREFGRMIAATTVFVTAKNALLQPQPKKRGAEQEDDKEGSSKRQKKADGDEQQQCVERLVDTVLDFAKTGLPEEKLVEALVAEIAGSLPDRDNGAFIRVIQKCLEPTDAVHALMHRRLKGVVYKLVTEGQLPDNDGTAAALRQAPKLFERLTALSERVARLASINLAVHLPTYNRLMIEATAAATASAPQA